MLTWKRLQSEHKAWTEFNFPPHTFVWPLWGTIEELGELVHARLKQEQGIRGTSEEHLANQKDSVGDGIVFLSDVCTQRGWDLGELAKTDGPDDFQKTYKCPAKKSPIRVCLAALSTLMSCLEDHGWSQDSSEKDLFDAHARQAVHQYLIGLSGYCHEKGWSLHEIVDETWRVVKTRNWRKNPRTGEVQLPLEKQIALEMDREVFAKEDPSFLPLSEMVKEDVPPTKSNWAGISPPPKKSKKPKEESDR